MPVYCIRIVGYVSSYFLRFFAYDNSLNVLLYVFTICCAHECSWYTSFLKSLARLVYCTDYFSHVHLKPTSICVSQLVIICGVKV